MNRLLVVCTATDKAVDIRLLTKGLPRTHRSLQAMIALLVIPCIVWASVPVSIDALNLQFRAAVPGKDARGVGPLARGERAAAQRRFHLNFQQSPNDYQFWPALLP